MGKRRKTGRRHYLAESRRWDTAVLLVVPLLVLYEVGLLVFSDGSVRNAADVVMTRYLLHLGSGRAALILNGCVLLVFLAAAIKRGQRATPGLLSMVVVESALWSFTLPLLGWLMERLAALSAAPDVTLWGDLALGIGAGVYEELLFRLGLLSVSYLLLHRLLGLDPIWAAVTALLLSAGLFSGFHHWGEFGEDWDTWRFVFRFLAGLVLGGLFLCRGLAVACWTHALYNVHVILAAG